MFFEQFKYPFSEAVFDSNFYNMYKLTFQRTDQTQNNRIYKHVGIERPHAIPLSELDSSGENIKGVYNWPIIVAINPPEDPGKKQEEHKFYIIEQEKFEVKLDNDSAIKVYLPESELNNKYLIINAGYEIAN